MTRVKRETARGRVLDAVRRTPGCRLDELVVSLPGLTWHQVVLELDRLTRTRRVHLMALGDGNYAVRMPSRRK